MIWRHGIHIGSALHRSRPARRSDEFAGERSCGNCFPSSERVWLLQPLLPRPKEGWWSKTHPRSRTSKCCEMAIQDDYIEAYLIPSETDGNPHPKLPPRLAHFGPVGGRASISQIASASSVLQLGLLHMWPLQYWLKPWVPPHAWHHGRLRVPVWLSGRALRQQRKRLWVRFPGNTHTNENV